MPAASCFRSPGARGFTLLELLVVLTIAGLMLALVPPSASRLLPGVQERHAARDVAASLQVARNTAIARQRPQALQIDLESKRFELPGHSPPRPLPEWLGLDVVVGDATPALGLGRIVFYPDGSSTGGRITLLGKHRDYVVDVDWLTGRVRVDER